MSKKQLAEIDKALREARATIDQYDEKWGELRDFNQAQQGVKERYWEEGRKEQMRGKKHAVRTATLELMDFKHVCDTKTKIENEMEAVLRRLHRLRQQIIDWVGNLDLRNREGELVDTRKQIELRYKRGKSFYKLGVSSDQTENAEAQREEERQTWINEYISILEAQADAFEAEMEASTSGHGTPTTSGGTPSKRKGKGGAASTPTSQVLNKDRIDQLTAFVELHKMHIRKLEGILRQLRNKALTIQESAVEELRELLQPYIEENGDLTIVLAEDIYADLGLDSSSGTPSPDTDEAVDSPTSFAGALSPRPPPDSRTARFNIAGPPPAASVTARGGAEAVSEINHPDGVAGSALASRSGSVNVRSALAAVASSLSSSAARGTPTAPRAVLLADSRKRLTEVVGGAGPTAPSARGLVEQSTTSGIANDSKFTDGLSGGIGRGSLISPQRHSLNATRVVADPIKVAARDPWPPAGSASLGAAPGSVRVMSARDAAAASVSDSHQSTAEAAAGKDSGTASSSSGGAATGGSDMKKDLPASSMVANNSNGSGGVVVQRGGVVQRGAGQVARPFATSASSSNDSPAVAGTGTTGPPGRGEQSADGAVADADGGEGQGGVASSAADQSVSSRWGTTAEGPLGSDGHGSGGTRGMQAQRLNALTGGSGDQQPQQQMQQQVETAVGSWVALDTNQLNVEAGQLISILAIDESGWTYGSVVSRERGERQFGWFPDHLRRSASERPARSSQTEVRPAGSGTANGRSTASPTIEGEEVPKRSGEPPGAVGLPGAWGGGNRSGFPNGSSPSPSSSSSSSSTELIMASSGVVPPKMITGGANHSAAPFSWEKLVRGNVNVVHVIPEQVELRELKWTWKGELANEAGTRLLHFNVGETVEVLVEHSGGWVFGRIHGEPERQGWFPEYMLTSPTVLLADLLEEMHRLDAKKLRRPPHQADPPLGPAAFVPPGVRPHMSGAPQHHHHHPRHHQHNHHHPTPNGTGPAGPPAAPAFGPSLPAERRSSPSYWSSNQAAAVRGGPSHQEATSGDIDDGGVVDGGDGSSSSAVVNTAAMGLGFRGATSAPTHESQKRVATPVGRS